MTDRNYKIRRRRPQHRRNIYIEIGTILMILICIVLTVIRLIPDRTEDRSMELSEEGPAIDVQLLTENPYSRPGTQTDPITGIVIHYTANPGASAQNNRDYFESLKDTGANKVSSNFVVGLEGEIIQCVPTWEVAYASNSRNHDTVSIECCHPDETGEFTEATYHSVVELTAWLCVKFDLDEHSVIRHYDVTGKNCPKYYVENPEKWEAFIADVGAEIANLKNH